MHTNIVIVSLSAACGLILMYCSHSVRVIQVNMSQNFFHILYMMSLGNECQST